jgi:hypothetical protein
MAQWRFKSLESGVEFEMPLSLYWEINGDPITDDYTPEEISARELWDLWVERYGSNVMPIMWMVHGDAKAEFAPPSLQPQLRDLLSRDLKSDSEEGFLAYYPWPVDSATGEHLRWSSLPVEDKLWRPGNATKGGFIQEATGWKPSPLQSHADIKILAMAAGLKQPRTPTS